jgi:glycoprotein endo-alpha-1,2-mannosidase
MLSHSVFGSSKATNPLSKLASLMATILICTSISLIAILSFHSESYLSKILFFFWISAADGFTYGSTSRNWKSMVEWAQSKGLLSSISVGPGYDDTRIRPWNAQNTKSRDHGKYYDSHWQAAIEAKPEYISVTSYNEWMEGTQIEAVQPKKIEKTIFDGKAYTYQDYGDLPEDYYMTRTAEWTNLFLAR